MHYSRSARRHFERKLLLTEVQSLNTFRRKNTDSLSIDDRFRIESIKRDPLRERTLSNLRINSHYSSLNKKTNFRTNLLRGNSLRILEGCCIESQLTFVQTVTEFNLHDRRASHSRISCRNLLHYLSASSILRWISFKFTIKSEQKLDEKAITLAS